MAAVAAGRRALTERLPFPTDTEIAVLHERLLARHAYAEEAAVERLLPVLTQMVRRSFHRTDETMIADAVEDALLEYSGRPEQFDRSRGVPLLAFLRMSAARNLTNLLRAEMRRRSREAHMHEQLIDPAVVDSIDTASHQPEDLTSLFDLALARAVTPQETRAVALWLEGNGTAALAAALGVAHLPSEQQRRTIKQLKDRVKKRLQRILRR